MSKKPKWAWSRADYAWHNLKGRIILGGIAVAIIFVLKLLGIIAVS